MNFINRLKDIFSIEELKNKILLTIGLIAVYRFMAAVPLPGIDPLQLAALKESTSGGLLGLLNAFTGGAFARASVMALGIMPYISASIVVQLMGIAVPYLQKLQKDGEGGRKKITQITRWLTIAITLVQAPTYITAIKTQFNLPPEAFLVSGATFWVSSIIILTAGTIFAMWLGERITEKGIGNGISLLIMIGIIANLPSAFVFELGSRLGVGGTGGIIVILLEIAVLLLVIVISILLVQGTRRIPVQYAKRVVGNKQYGGVRQYIPLKVNASGVMPIIFAQAIMFVPMTLAGFGEGGAASSWVINVFGNPNGLPPLAFNLGNLGPLGVTISGFASGGTAGGSSGIEVAFVGDLNGDGFDDIILLKCTSTYPAQATQSNILTIPHLRHAFGCQVGLSDHTAGVGVAVAAVALGATVVEKHFVLDRQAGGVDAAFSLEPKELTALVTETQRAHQALGQVTYGGTQAEETSKQYRRSIYVSDTIQQGQKLSAENLRIVRPAFGLAPKNWEKVLGKVAKVSLEKGTPLDWSMFE